MRAFITVGHAKVSIKRLLSRLNVISISLADDGKNTGSGVRYRIARVWRHNQENSLHSDHRRRSAAMMINAAPRRDLVKSAQQQYLYATGWIHTCNTNISAAGRVYAYRSTYNLTSSFSPLFRGRMRLLPSHILHQLLSCTGLETSPPAFCVSALWGVHG